MSPPLPRRATNDLLIASLDCVTWRHIQIPTRNIKVLVILMARMADTDITGKLR